MIIPEKINEICENKGNSNEIYRMQGTNISYKLAIYLIML